MVGSLLACFRPQHLGIKMPSAVQAGPCCSKAGGRAAAAHRLHAAAPSPQRVAPSWALGSAARPPASLPSAATAGHDGPVPSAEPPAAPEQPESPQQPLAAGSPPQPRRRSSAVLRASSTELEPIAENVAEEAGWGGAEWWRLEEEGEEQVEPPYTRLTSLSLPASTELPGGPDPAAVVAFFVCISGSRLAAVMPCKQAQLPPI